MERSGPPTSQPLRTAAAAVNIGTFEELARQLIERNPEIEWPQSRSLAAKLGQIDKRNPVWWISKPECTQALCSLLQVPEIDLGLHARGADASSYEFVGFPELPPLQFQREKACEIGRPVPVTPRMSVDSLDFWFKPTFARPWQARGQTHWISFSAGTGRTIFWKQLRAGAVHEIREVQTLSELTERLRSPTPLIIHLDGDEVERDAEVLAERHPDLALLIISPRGPHRRGDTENESPLSWEYLSTDHRTRRKLEDSNPTDSSIAHFEWQLYPDWQDRLLDWIERRIRSATADTLLTSEGVRRWISGFSGEVKRLQPADLLAICQICHSTPEKQLPSVGERNVGLRLLTRLRGVSGGRVELFETLVKAHLESRELAWARPLPRRDWVRLAGDGPPVGAHEVLAVAAAKTAKERSELARQLIDRQERTRVESLIDQHLLVQIGSGQYQLHPPFVADLIARDHLIRRIKTEPVAAWVDFCFDSERQYLVDAALLALQPSELVAVYSQIEPLDPLSGTFIAASETLFYAIGLHSAKGAAIPRALHALALPVLQGILRSPNQFDPTMWTRRARTAQDAALHLSACWAWSLLTPAPAAFAPEFLGWIFPGWCPNLDDAFAAGHDIDLADSIDLKCPEHALLTAVARRLLEKLDHTTGAAPRPLQPLLVARALTDGRDFNPYWLSSVLDNSELEDALAAELRDAPPAAATRLLSIHLELQAAADDNQWRFSYSRLRWRALEKLTAEGAQQLTPDHWTQLARNAVMLPPNVRTLLLERIADGQVFPPELMRAAVHSAGASDSRSLARLLDVSPTSAEAARRLWSAAPQEAESMMTGRQAASAEGRSMLLLNSPVDRIESAALAIAADPSLFRPHEVRLWVKWRLPDAGRHAGALLALYAAAGESAGPLPPSRKRKATAHTGH